MRISDWSSDVCSSDLFDIDIVFSDRRSRTVGGNLTAAGWQRLVFSPTARSFSIAPELAIELGDDWMARASIVYGKSDSRYHSAFEPTAGPRTLTTGCFCNSALNAEFLFDGSRSEEHTSELQSLMRISYAVFCLKKKKIHKIRIK